MWLVTADDLKQIYECIKRGHRTLWCDQKVSESEHASRKRKMESESTAREEKEEEVERVYTELVGKHEYSISLLGQGQLLLIIMMTMMSHQTGHSLHHKHLKRNVAKIHFLTL